MDDLEELVEYDGETDHIFVVFFIAPEEGLLLLDQFHGQVHFQFFGIFHFLQRENGEVELDQEFEVVVDFSELFGGDLGVDQLQDHFLDILVPVFLHIDEVLDEIHILLELLRELLYFLIEYVDQGLVSLLLKDEVLESLLQLNQHLYFVRVVGGLEDFFRLRQEEVLVDLFALGQERVQGRRVDVLVEGIKQLSQKPLLFLFHGFFVSNERGVVDERLEVHVEELDQEMGVFFILGLCADVLRKHVLKSLVDGLVVFK